MKQISERIFMVRPAHFGYNEQTAASNTFQNATISIENPQHIAQQEFDQAVEKLQGAGIHVWVIEDNPDAICPDAIFPNNWISTHEDGTIVLYPMLTPNRRSERREDIVVSLEKNYQVSRMIDLSKYEQDGKFLEGTGSIVFDHDARIAYACLSPRTDQKVLLGLCQQLSYTPVCFHSVDEHGIDVYHTNVIMGIGKGFAIICLDSILDKHERNSVITALITGQKEIIEISFAQVKSFAGNVLAIQNDKGEQIVALSESAYIALSEQQKKSLEQHSTLLPISIPNIETIGGGSVRCMLAQNFLKPC
ncbi:MAG: arginine deiminase-related protein [Phycisphaerales bacterium]|nr:arginine deiminase-related protein [Phycisphaerales bacterium]